MSDVVSMLGAHYPATMSAEDVRYIYERYYKDGRQLTHVKKFLRFLERMADERLIVIECIEERIIWAALRKSMEVKQILNLPRCLMPYRSCHDRGCAHHEDCHVFKKSMQELERRRSVVDS